MSVGNRLQMPPSPNNLEPLYDAAVLSEARSGTDLVKPSGSFSKKPLVSLTLGESSRSESPGQPSDSCPYPKTQPNKADNAKDSLTPYPVLLFETYLDTSQRIQNTTPDGRILKGSALADTRVPSAVARACNPSVLGG